MYKKVLKNKLIVVPVAGAIVVGAFVTQQAEINQLERELQIQQNITDQKYNYTETKIDISTIQERLNEECNFKILDGTINIRHTYVYQRDSILGLKGVYKLVGTADFYYAMTVDLSQADIINATDRQITIRVPRASIDDGAYHRVPNSFVRINEECATNFLANKMDTEKATRQWEDSFDTKGVEYVENYLTRDNIRNKIDNLTARQVKLLLEKLGYSQDIEVIIK